MISALVKSMKNAPIIGTTRNAFGAGPRGAPTAAPRAALRRACVLPVRQEPTCHLLVSTEAGHSDRVASRRVVVRRRPRRQGPTRNGCRYQGQGSGSHARHRAGDQVGGRVHDGGQLRPSPLPVTRAARASQAEVGAHVPGLQARRVHRRDRRGAQQARRAGAPDQRGLSVEERAPFSAPASRRATEGSSRPSSWAG